MAVIKAQPHMPGTRIFSNITGEDNRLFGEVASVTVDGQEITLDREKTYVFFRRPLPGVEIGVWNLEVVKAGKGSFLFVVHDIAQHWSIHTWNECFLGNTMGVLTHTQELCQHFTRPAE